MDDGKKVTDKAAREAAVAQGENERKTDTTPPADGAATSDAGHGDKADDGGASERLDDEETAVVSPAQESQDRIESLMAENAALKERLLRAVAETENIRKRGERETAEARQYALTAFARDLLAVADNLGRALDAVSGENVEHSDETAKSLLSGVEMTAREMHNAFKRHGIVKFDPQGHRFDPNIHQAMFEVEDPQIESGTVAHVVQAGYKIGGRVLRPAMVGVAKSGLKPQNTDKTMPEAKEEPMANPGEEPDTEPKPTRS
ncbi:MAG: nucleotide exchange factor GrpE [Hyphomicrobiales bacterium]